MKLFFVLLCLVFCLSWSSAQTKMTQEDYINKYFSLAVEEMNRYKIPASIILAQGLIETESGNSLLASKANNHFGIKCKAEWTGAIFIKDDDTKNECFRAYGAVEESYRDHSLFLLKPRYGKLFSYDMTDYRSWAYGLKEAGYATNPNYPAMLIKYIEELKLYQFDKFGMEKSSLKTIKPLEPAPRKFSEEELIKLRMQLANNIELVIVNEDFDIYKLASMKKLPVNILMEFNDVEGEQTLRLGQNFFLSKKEKANAKAKHIVLKGESLYDISQIYGVSLKQLRKYNKLESWEQPYAEEIIYLSGVRESFMKSRPFYQIERERTEKNLKLFIPLDITPKPEPAAAIIKSSKIIEPLSNPVTNIQSKMAIEAKDTSPVITNISNETNKPRDISSVKTKGDSATIEKLSLSEKVWINHSVKPKETIFRVSKIYNCNPNDILIWNAINIEQGLKVGQVLRIHTLFPNGLEIDAPANENLKSILTIEMTKLESKPSQKPRAVILKSQTLKSAIIKTDETRIGNGIKAERVSIQELYKNTKRDSTRLDTAIGRRIKLSGD